MKFKDDKALFAKVIATKDNPEPKVLKVTQHISEFNDEEIYFSVTYTNEWLINDSTSENVSLIDVLLFIANINT